MADAKTKIETKIPLTPFSLITSRKTVAFAFSFTSVFVVGFTALLLLNPSSNRSNTLFSHFLPNSTSQSNHYPPPVSQPQDNPFQLSQDSDRFGGKVETFSSDVNNGGPKIQVKGNASSSYQSLEFRGSGNGSKEGFLEKERVASNLTLGGSSDEVVEKLRKEDFVEIMSHCRIFDGEWVRDDSYPLYAPGSCPYIDESFNCFGNGRPDRGYEKYRWQPSGCNIPRLNGKHMLELLRGKRVAFVGDSLGRNMWQSLVCALRNSAEQERNVFEASGRHELRTEGSYSILFEDYNCSVEYFRSPFLVREWQMLERDGSKKETLRLDMIDKSSDKYKDADILLFNTGHWWTHDKTSKGKGYYQEGSTVYDRLNVKEAFRKALTTWGRWIDSNIDTNKTLVFFRGFSASHFRGGRWNSGGQCDGETEPITNEKYLKKYPSKMRIFESVRNGMTTPVLYLNVSRMTGFRKDGHPSIYRKQNLTEEERTSPTRIQDCSHWCLPGVPDTWNELVYAQLLIKHIQQQQLLQQKQRQRRQ